MTGTQWTYTGDMNCEYGGAWFDLSTWEHGYVSAVRVTDLDSGCGFRGACLIEHVVVNDTDDSARIRRAIRSCGGFRGAARQQAAAGRRVRLCASVGLSYATPDCILADRLSDDGREDDAQWVRGYADRAAAVKECLRLMIAEALMSYGYAEPDDGWDNYLSHHSETVQMESDGPMESDEGWKADKRLHGTDLRAYVESIHLS